ncbi:hypothetical protein SAMN06265795_10675 [Noviherbaspirillum humi]|uniref:Transmembrane protein n=1 Tax=Noviherbaspirillum humi TaxID=1688639 RepID=A0A239H437_9BURK|nr:hypothetical protein [Noviherbaspirillum humi]SNS75925.1 hypothetical protein SAMN06265795_10675 [Noviherbaspirillum humi]
MYIIAIAWIYVVFMMAITEHSVIAGIMTFLLYGVFPLSIILYIMGTPRRKRMKAEREKMQAAADAQRQAAADPAAVERGKRQEN